MKRRSFLQGLLGLVAVAAAPAIAQVPRRAGWRVWLVSPLFKGDHYVAVMHPDTEREFWEGMQWTPEQLAGLEGRAATPAVFNRIISGGIDVPAMRQRAGADLKAQGVSWA